MFCLNNIFQRTLIPFAAHETICGYKNAFYHFVPPLDSPHKNLKKCQSKKFISNTVNVSTEREIGNGEFLKNVGQPTSFSHPYLIQPGELVPGTSLNEFVDRRNRFVEAILSARPGWNHIVIIPSSEVLYMTEKIPYIFRQNSDFRYLCGCLEPDSALLFSISEGCSKVVVFVRENNKHSELWEGPRTGVTRAAKMFGVDEAYPITHLAQVLKTLSNNQSKPTVLWYDVFNPVNRNVHKMIISHITEGGQKELETPRDIIHQLRLIKSKSEQDMLRKSALVAAKAIQKAMEITKPGITEHQLFATVDYHCRMDGAENLAYPPVVATGTNATVIHYINNNQECQDGEMILMDAGCELHGYCSDITRTWPANGEFSDIQRTLYEIVLSVQMDLIAKSSELPTLDVLFNYMCKLLGERLKEGHVLSKAAATEKLEKIAFKLCPHHVSHYLGMDVHDTSSVPRSIKLKEGMIFTIEPGVYIDHECDFARPEFRGCGIRIEDDVLITSSGPEVLSLCPKNICDIEQLIKRVQN